MNNTRQSKMLCISVLLGFIIAFTPNTVRGQNPDSFPGRCNGPGRGFHAKDKKVRKSLLTLKIWKLTEALSVDENLAEKLFPCIRELEQMRFDQEQERNRDMEELRQLLENESDRRSIEKKLLEIKRKQEKTRQAIQKEREKIMHLLTIEQQAKYLLVEHDFPRTVRRFMKERRRNRRQRTPKHAR